MQLYNQLRRHFCSTTRQDIVQNFPFVPFHIYFEDVKNTSRVPKHLFNLVKPIKHPRVLCRVYPPFFSFRSFRCLESFLAADTPRMKRDPSQIRRWDLLRGLRIGSILPHAVKRVNLARSTTDHFILKRKITINAKRINQTTFSL